MKKTAILSTLLLLCTLSLNAQETETLYLSGHGSDDTVEWDFFCSAGANSGKWSKIAVPSVWECQGFGQYTYGHMPLEQRLNEKGIYRHRFNVPSSWKGRNVELVFCGVMTDTKVSVNGKSAGAIHQGGHYEFRYDITSLLRYGAENRIEVNVDKMSSNESLVKAERKADFWVFGGIFRPVYLEARPSSHIGRFGIDARADGSISVKAQVKTGLKGCRLAARVKDSEGKNVGETFFAEVTKDACISLNSRFNSVALWSAEFPNLYTLELSLIQKDGKVLHRTSERFGFRTIELRPSDGIYVNGAKMKFRGVDRHSFWPTTGRTLNDRINLEDARLIKEMNMNAVRCSHYPPEKGFLDICDSLGLYVIDELTGWQDAVDCEVGRPLVREMILRDVNHPSVLLWANGNEGGFNFELDPDYDKWDIQKRPVIHPWKEDELINTFHYPYYDSVREYLAKGRKIWMPTEFNHGLYDGGHGASLEDLWKVMYASPLCAGGFLWDLVDQGLARKDLNGILDTDGNHGADGILGPYREKEGSFYAIKDIWSPIQLEGRSFLPGSFDGRLTIENRYDFTNLNQCKFKAEARKICFLSGKSKEREIKVTVPSVEPGLKGRLSLDLPADFKEFDVLGISAFGPDGRLVCNWSFNIGTAGAYASKLLASDKTKAGKNPVSNIRFAENPGKNSVLDVKELESGWTEVSYELRNRAYYDNIGVTFDFPEEEVLSVKWLGNGPYRVWKNRLRGACFGLWEQKYNDTATGESWDYPEFKGYRSNMYAADLETRSGVLRIVFASDDLFLRLFTPAKQEKRNNDNTLGVFPEGQISVLNAISAVGTKFKKASETGPDGAKNYLEYVGKRTTTHGSGHFYMKFIPKK